MSDWVENAWYMAGWADEVGGSWLARRLLDRPILLYRTQDGQPVALTDRCPHRFAPLHRGRQVGDLVECGYHGLQFDPFGRCVRNQLAGGTVPAGTSVRSYPIVERHRMLWTWMGDPELADELLIPDYSLVSSPDYGWCSAGAGNWIEMDVDYRLVIDNLLDLTHTSFLHAQSFAGFAASLDQGKLNARAQGDRVAALLLVENLPWLCCKDWRQSEVGCRSAPIRRLLRNGG